MHPIMIILPCFNDPDKDTKEALMMKKLVEDKNRKFEKNKERF